MAFTREVLAIPGNEGSVHEYNTEENTKTS